MLVGDDDPQPLTFGLVMPGVLGLRHELKVTNAVIRAVPVPVVNDHATRDRPAKVMPSEPVLQRPSGREGSRMIRSIDLHIASTIDVAKYRAWSWSAARGHEEWIAVASPASDMETAPAASLMGPLASIDDATTVRRRKPLEHHVGIAMPQPAMVMHPAPARRQVPTRSLASWDRTDSGHPLRYGGGRG